MPLCRTQSVHCRYIIYGFYHKQCASNLNDFIFTYSHQSDILINKLGVTSSELISLRVVFIARVTSHELFLLHELLLLFAYESQVTIYCTNYELLFTYELRVIVYCTSYELFLLLELRVIVYLTSYELLFIAPVASYFLDASYGLNFKCEQRVTF